MLREGAKVAIAVAIAAYLREEAKLRATVSRPSPWRLLGRLEALASHSPGHRWPQERGWRYVQH